MGGLGTRFAQVGIATPKPLIPVDGAPMVHKALSSFDELLVRGARGTTKGESEQHQSLLDIRVVFVVRTEHEAQFQLRSLLLESFRSKYGCESFWCVNDDGTDPHKVERINETATATESSSEKATISSGGETPHTNKESAGRMSVYFVMMHSDTRGAAETCLLAEPALLMTSPVVILDCDLFVYSSRLNRVLLGMATRGDKEVSAKDEKSLTEGGSTPIPSHILASLRGALVFFNSRAPRYSYAVVEPIPDVDLSDPKKELSAGGKVTRTAEKIPISNCSLIGAYTFAAAGWFVAAARRLLEHPINPDTGMKEYYISLLYNFLLDPSFTPYGFDAVEAGASTNQVLVLAVPKEGYASFGTPDELANYVAGRESYVLE